jgi:SAM-dependent methyltransferase
MRPSTNIKVLDENPLFVCNMNITRYKSFAKYVITAMLLKFASVFPDFYRFLGNKFGQQRRLQCGIPNSYGKRAKRFLEWYKNYQMVQEGDEVLEIGTGWVHFESIVIRLFYDIRATLFDVWDNRQLDALKHFTVQLEELLYQEMDLTNAEKERIKKIIVAIAKMDSFDALYEYLNFQYVINPQGTLELFQDETFKLVYSCNVFEHIDRRIAPELVKDIYRILEPGGYSCQDIDLTDHLVSFREIRNISPKFYLSFSERMWKVFFENKVQYINRIQCSEWLNLFESAGLDLLEKEVETENIDLKRVSKIYRHLGKHDLECTRLRVIHRKPLL